jgi:hypothetical protein
MGGSAGLQICRNRGFESNRGAAGLRLGTGGESDRHRERELDSHALDSPTRIPAGLHHQLQVLFQSYLSQNEMPLARALNRNVA